MLRPLLALMLVTSQVHAVSLNSEQQAALAEARQRYRVRILENPGTGDVVVLLGETHIKFRKARDLGRKVLAQFGTRGLESEDDAEMSRAMRSQEAWTGALFGGLNKITNDRGPYGSTLTEALSEPPNPGAGDRNIVALERLEQGESVHPLTYVFYAEYSAVQLMLPLALVKSFGIGKWAGRGLLVLAPVLMASGYAGFVFARPWEQASLVEKIAFHLHYGVLERRNDLMAKNISRSHEGRAGQPLLAIMGSAHVGGIAKLLQNKYGYVDVEQASVDPAITEVAAP